MVRQVMSWLKPNGRVSVISRTSRALAFSRDSKGMAAIEFALVGSIFLFVMLFVMDLGLQQFTQAAMDAATQAAARQIQIGTYRTTDPSAVQTLVCTRLSVLAPGCNTDSPTTTRLTVNAASGIRFSTLAPASPPFTNSFAPGGSRSYVLLQVAYKRPRLLPIASFAEPYLVSSVIFENEP